MQKFKLFSLTATLLSTAWMTGCVSTTVPGSVAAERKQLMFYPDSWTQKKSDKIYNTYEKESKKTNRYVIDPRLNTILDRLVIATKTYQLPERKIDWSVRLNLSSTINAMSLPNGKIILNSAIAWNDLTDDELAFLISHEMSHVLREHARERKSVKYASNSALLLAATGLGQIPAFFTVYGGQLASSVPLSRVMETEADLIGLDLMARAGYEPKAALSFWDKTEARMKKRNIEPSKLAEFLSSHPDIADRKVILQANMASAEKQYLLAIQQQKPAHQHIHENVETAVTTFDEQDVIDAAAYSHEGLIASVK